MIHQKGVWNMRDERCIEENQGIKDRTSSLFVIAVVQQ